MAVASRVPASESRNLDRALRRYERAARYVAEHFDQLVSKYPERWVAVQDGKVVASSKTRADLRKQIADAGPDIARPYVTYLTKKTKTLIL
jgi:hypothetical protein